MCYFPAVVSMIQRYLSLGYKGLRVRKQLGVMLLATFVCALLAACGGDGAERDAGHVRGVTDTEIRVGSSLPLSGHASYLGRQTLRGALAYIRHINEQGGVHGRQINIVSYDDHYDPPLCVSNTQRLIINDEVFSLFCYVGTPTTVKVIPLVEEARIPLLGAYSGANALREPFHPYIFNIRASYYQETEELVRRYVEELGIRRFAVFYQYDAFGFDGLKGTEIALRKHGLAPVARGSYKRGTLDVEEGLSRIAASGAEAVIIIGSYTPSARFIRLCHEQGFRPIFHNVAFVGAEELSRLLGSGRQKVFVTQVVPPVVPLEESEQLSGVAEYVALLARYYPGEKPNSVGLEGFINARVLVEALRRSGRDITREKFIDAVESIREFSIGMDNPLSFSQTDHQGSDRVYFLQLKDGRFEVVSDWDDVSEWIDTQKKSCDE